MRKIKPQIGSVFSYKFSLHFSRFKKFKRDIDQVGLLDSSIVCMKHFIENAVET